MIYYCSHVECPRNRTGQSTRIDLSSKMPVVYHYCTCEGRENNKGVCLKCSGLKG